MNYRDTWNQELRKHYRIGYDGETIYKYRDRMESYYQRILKYMGKYKSKKLIFEHGCYNMDVKAVELTDMYELRLTLGNGVPVRLDLRTMIEDNVQMRYDTKYHAIHFINTY
jgi:hypothetical protein